MIAKVYLLLNFLLVIATVTHIPLAWRRRNIPGATPILICLCWTSVVAATNVFDIFTDFQVDRIFKEKLLIFITIFSMISWAWMITEVLLQKKLRWYIWLLLEPVIIGILLFTNSYHHLFYHNVDISTIGSPPIITFDYGIARIIHVIFIAIVWIGTAIWGIFQHFKKPKVPTFWVVIMIGMVIFGVIDRIIVAQGYIHFRNAFVFGFLAVWAIRFYRLLDILPIARKQIVDNLESGIAIINSDNLIVDTNDNFEKLLHTTVPSKAPYMSLSTLLDQSDIDSLNNDSFTHRGMITTEDDRSLAFSILSIEDKGLREGKTMVVRDVTEQAKLAKQKEYYTEQLEISKEQLEQLNQMKSNFFSNITHEFRTPLTLITEPARLLLKHPDRSIHPNALLVKKNADRLLHLVNQLLSLTKIDGGKMDVAMQHGDLTSVIKNEYQKFLPAAEDRKMTMRLQVERNFPLIQFDQSKMESIISNLLSNALKYSEEGMIEMTLSIDSDDAQSYKITVTDQGHGISKENQEHIFDRFYQVETQNTRRGPGSGIGLALTKQLVELLEGSIVVESQVGVGTTFTIKLPLHTDLSKAVVQQPTQSESNFDYPSLDDSRSDESIPDIQSPQKEDRRIALIVEDNTELRRFIKSGLVDIYQVLEAANGSDGLNQAKQLLPDIIISDVMMPEMDGLSMLQELRSEEQTAHIPVVLLTSKSSVEDQLKGLTYGADDYLTKPFRMDELLLRCQNIIDNRIRAIQQYVANYDPLATKKPMKPEVDQFIKKFLQVIESELANETISIDDYADHMNMSRIHLYRKIKTLTDQSPSVFIREYKLERAMAMLRAQEGTILEIANQLGFVNVKYFATAFKKKFGLSPREV